MSRTRRKGRYSWMSLLLLCALVICMLSACGTKNDKAPSPEPTVTPEETADVDNEPSEAERETEEPAPKEKVTNLKDAYSDKFSIGVAINRRQLEDDELLAVVKENFNSITMENEMKPSSLLDQQASAEGEDGMPKIDTRNLSKILELAKENGLKMRGHVLVWHNQTPEWFFHEEYEWDTENVSKEVMLQRMESYIKQVLEFCQENYPGVLYAWDVVNEAISDDSGYRTESLWYETIGEEFIEKAFEYARKYAADDVKLFYNDYNEYNVMKRENIYMMVEKLKEKDLIDGVGMQSHIDMDHPSVTLIEDAILRYTEIGDMEIQLTELDMHNTSDDDESFLKQAVRYKLIFEMLLRLHKEGKANITNVTFWGLTDGDTWLSSFKQEESFPLLFDIDLQPKLAYEYLLNVVNGDE